MAQKFGYTGGYAWNLEQCEEEILIAAYDEIFRFITADQTWKYDFETHFFVRGDGVAAKFLESINTVRKRRGLDIIVIRETDVFDYARSCDKLLKSNNRRRIRDELKDASAAVRQHRIDRAKAEEQRLPPPHRTYEEYKALRKQQEVRSGLTLKEITKRALAQHAASAAPLPTKSKLSPERAAKMLAIASPSIRGEIIQKLSADDALEVAEKIQDTEVRDALVRHSLGAS